MKTYVNPMLQVVSIKKNDIVTASDTLGLGSSYSGGVIQAGDRFRDFEEDYSY